MGNRARAMGVWAVLAAMLLLAWPESCPAQGSRPVELALSMPIRHSAASWVPPALKKARWQARAAKGASIGTGQPQAPEAVQNTAPQTEPEAPAPKAAAKASQDTRTPVPQPQGQYARRIQASILLKQGKVDRGLQLYLSMVQADPQNVDLRADYADALMSQERLDAAATQIKVLVGLAPKKPAGAPDAGQLPAGDRTG